MQGMVPWRCVDRDSHLTAMKVLGTREKLAIELDPGRCLRASTSDHETSHSAGERLVQRTGCPFRSLKMQRAGHQRACRAIVHLYGRCGARDCTIDFWR